MRYLNAANLQAFIDENGIDAKILFLAVDAPTVRAAAEALAVVPEQIVKSVLFLADGEPVMVIASGLARLDRKVLAHTGYVARIED